MPTTCVNPKCFMYPIRGSNLCYSCSTKRDAYFLIGILVGAVFLIMSIVKVFS